LNLKLIPFVCVNRNIPALRSHSVVNPLASLGTPPSLNREQKSSNLKEKFCKPPRLRWQLFCFDELPVYLSRLLPHTASLRCGSVTAITMHFGPSSDLFRKSAKERKHDPKHVICPFALFPGVVPPKPTRSSFYESLNHGSFLFFPSFLTSGIFWG
jgi:hypothetical protein